MSAPAERAAEQILKHDPRVTFYDVQKAADIIDRETGLPEMIEALEKALPICAMMDTLSELTGTVHSLTPHEAYHDVPKIIRAALAKAQGKQD